MPQSQFAQRSISSTSTTSTCLFLLEEICSPLFSPVLCLCFLLLIIIYYYYLNKTKYKRTVKKVNEIKMTLNRN